jgi:two-component system heavy metal sensor histidine kinase CusS
MARAHSSFRRHIALQTMLVSGLVLGSFAVAACWFARTQLARNIDLQITEYGHRLASRLTSRPHPDGFRLAVQDIFGEEDPANPTTTVFIIGHDENATILMASRSASSSESEQFRAHLPPREKTQARRPEGDRRRTPAPHSGSATTPDDGQKQRAPGRPASAENMEPAFFDTMALGDRWRFGAFGRSGYTVFVGISLHHYYAEARRQASAMAIAALLGLFLAGLGAWWSSLRAVRSLVRIVTMAEGLNAADLGQRIPIGNRDYTEFVQLISVLNGMMDRLRKSFEQSARFTADASHELKTPLAVLQAALHDALRHSEPGGAAYESMESAAREVARLKHITQSLLTLSQADAGKLPLSRENYDLSAELERLLEDAATLSASADLRCEWTVAPSVHIYADRALMWQVFQNLLSNAVKHNRTGGGLTMTLERCGRWAEFTITNTSDPMSAETQARLFERFYRSDGSRIRHNEGFGLGLNIAFEFAKANGAELRLIQALEDSVSFGLRIPGAEP